MKALSDTEEKWAEQRQKWAEQQHSPFVLYTLARAPPRCTLRFTFRTARTVRAQHTLTPTPVWRALSQVKLDGEGGTQAPTAEDLAGTHTHASLRPYRPFFVRRSDAV